MSNSIESVISDPENLKGMIVGGWTAYRPLNEDDEIVFKKAMGDLMGVNYTPLVVATQVVNGVNYSFFCNQQIIIPNPPNQAAMVSVHISAQGKTTIMGISQVGR